MIDEQDADMMALTSMVLAARAEVYSAYDKCAALLVREFGTYKVENGSVHISVSIYCGQLQSPSSGHGCRGKAHY